MPRKNQKHGKHSRNYKKIEGVKSTKSKKTLGEKSPESKTKKTAKKEKTTKIEESGNYKRIMVYTAAIVGMVAVIFLALTLIETQEDHVVPSGHTDEGELVASVNNEGLYSDELEKRLEMYQAQFGPTFTKQMAINETITEMLLVQEAEKEGIEVSQGLVDSKVNEWVTELEQTVPEEQIEQLLAAENMTLEQYIDELRQSVEVRLLVTELLNKTVLSETEKEYSAKDISDAELEEEFEENIEKYQQIKASHILICYEDSMNCQVERSKDEAEELAKEIYEKIKQGENFEELAEEYSDCPSGSEGGNLGWFTKRDMIDEFFNAASELRNNQISEQVHTEFGYHVIKKVDEKTSFDELKEEMKTQMEQEQNITWQEETFTQEQEVVNEYINQLWDEADIVYYEQETDDEDGSLY
ncbi:MAG: peptidylprolyl isomerase [Nanoarchaeota archaeon]